MKVVNLSLLLRKGEAEGHEFRGNQYTGGNGGAEGSNDGKERLSEKEQATKDRSDRAKASHKPSTAEKQQWGEKNETVIASLLGGQKQVENFPVDVIVKIGNQLHGIEVKSLLDNGNSKITIHPPSMVKKLAWIKQNKGMGHVIMIDDRKAFGSGRGKPYAKQDIYYKRGYGSYNLSAMIKVESPSHLMKLLREK